MASQLIAHVAAWYIPTGQPLVNDMDGLTIDGAYRLEAQRMHAELERRARRQPLCVEIDIRPVKNKRTLDQNRLMWALLNRLALALSGDTPGGVTAEQCYLDLLAEFGAEVEIWRVPVKALPALRNTYRVVQMVELLDDGYCMARLGLGSSSFLIRVLNGVLIFLHNSGTISRSIRAGSCLAHKVCQRLGFAGILQVPLLYRIALDDQLQGRGSRHTATCQDFQYRVEHSVLGGHLGRDSHIYKGAPLIAPQHRVVNVQVVALAHAYIGLSILGQLVGRAAFIQCHSQNRYCFIELH